MGKMFSFIDWKKYCGQTLDCSTDLTLQIQDPTSILFKYPKQNTILIYQTPKHFRLAVRVSNSSSSSLNSV